MTRLLHILFLLLAKATETELSRVVEYLKAENRILQDKLPKRVTVTPPRAAPAGPPQCEARAVKGLISIVSPRTFARWVAGQKSAMKKSTRQPGRPRTPEDIRTLVLRIARETGRGYTRILGELKKHGIQTVARTTAIKLLKENGLDPGPQRGQGTWDEFLRRHVQRLLACDFFSKKVWTCGGLVDVFVLFILHISTRRVYVAGMTVRPDPGTGGPAGSKRGPALRRAGIPSHACPDRPRHEVRARVRPSTRG
jgi:putative transposase